MSIFIKSAFGLKNKQENCNTNSQINKNYIIVKEIKTNNSICKGIEILVRKRREKVVKQKT